MRGTAGAMVAIRHYHVWIPAMNGRGMMMLAQRLTKAEVKRQQQRGSRRTVRRWWKSRTGARRALETAMRERGIQGGHVLECDLGDQCPEHAHIMAN